jgi:hypothetical protein
MAGGARRQSFVVQKGSRFRKTGKASHRLKVARVGQRERESYELQWNRLEKLVADFDCARQRLWRAGRRTLATG